MLQNSIYQYITSSYVMSMHSARWYEIRDLSCCCITVQHSSLEMKIFTFSLVPFLRAETEISETCEKYHILGGSRVVQRSQALYLSTRGVTTDPGSIPGCITTGHDWESYRALSGLGFGWGRPSL